MKVIEGIEDFPRDQFLVVTSGTFDGVHYGHKKILRRVKELASANNGKSAVLTFWPHPRFVLKKDETELKLLSTLNEKIKLIANEGIDYFVIIPFTKEFSQYSSSRFINEIIAKSLGTDVLVIGYDHRFGRNREGSFEYLKEHSSEFGFKVEEIPEQDIDHIAVSSSKIRNALLEGQIDVGNEYLGQPYTLSGKVVEGEKIGRELGFPTANIHVEESFKLIPADGIYAVELLVRKNNCQGMLYIGPRPTLNGRERTIEVNIFDFEEDIYNENVEVSFIKQIRKDKRFDNLDQLKDQLGNDRIEALKILQV